MTRAERETCLKTLTNCESLFVVPSHEGTLIQVVNFDRYQDQNEQKDGDFEKTWNQIPSRETANKRVTEVDFQKHGTNMEPTGNQHGTNMEPTGNRHGTKEEYKKKIKENKRISKNELSPSAQKFIQKLKLKERNHA
jgi:hypothetical protein